MQTQIDVALLDKVVTDVVSIDPRGSKPLSGYLAERLRREKHVEEAGLGITEDDFLFLQLYSSVAVLARDMHRHIDQYQRPDATKFQELVESVNRGESVEHGNGAFPEYVGLPDESITATVDLSAPDGRFDLSRLDDADLIREWHVWPGKRLLTELIRRKEVRQAVCGPGGPRDLVGKVKTAVDTAVVAKVSGAIITATFSAAAFWYPLATFGAVYLVKLGLDSYCKP